MGRWWLPVPTRRRVPLVGIALGFALSLGSAGVIANSTGDEATSPAGQAPRDCPEAEPNDEPANPATLAVHGLVIDAATKRGIARFRVIPGGLMSGGVTWQPHLITAHRGGRFDFPPDARAWDETRFRVEAEGYRPGVSRIVKKSEGDVKLTFALQADPGISAVALTPEGAPAAERRQPGRQSPARPLAMARRSLSPATPNGSAPRSSSPMRRAGFICRPSRTLA